jgi:MFS family permease
LSPSPPSLPARLPFFYGWVVVGVAFVTMAVGVNARTAFSLLFPPILEEFGATRALVAGVFSTGFVGSMLLGPLSGMLMDRFGPRWLVPFGAVMSGGGLMLATLATEAWHLYLTLGILSISFSTIVSYNGHAMFLPNWFARRRGMAIGIAFSGVGFGAIVLLPFLQSVIEDGGWRRACWTMAALLIVIAVPLNILLQRRRPEDMGLQPDGGDGKSTVDTKAPSNVVDAEWAARDWTIPRAARTTRFWWLVAGYFCCLFAWYGVQVHQTKYLIGVGFDAELAAFALGLVGLCGIVGQIAMGHLSDRMGREWGWTFSLSGYAICYALLLAMDSYPSTALVYLMVAAQGMLGYGLASLFGPIAMEIFHGRNAGAILGTLNMASGLGAAAGPWTFGLIYDVTGGYAAAFGLAIGISIASILCIWMAAPRRVRLVAGRVRH